MRFLPGLELSRHFHAVVVAPVLRRNFADLRYAAGRLDGGSELLGLDTSRSTDHDWGCRLQLFVGPADAHRVPEVLDAVDAALPATFLGLPTRFADAEDVLFGVAGENGVRHGVTAHELGGWFHGRLGFDPSRTVSTSDWLATPTQRLAEVTGGAVFHDGLDGVLTRARSALRWYPDDVWRYVLAAAWTRVAQAEHLPGRCAEVGAEVGSRVVAAGVARDLMRIGLLAGRRWPPYDKWLGTVFGRLPGAAAVTAALADALDDNRRAWRRPPIAPERPLS
ncbi:hypothetical protein Vqi01_18470 [Micromonospora qiuiae]|uniref:DUF4037 domain-containing protein n=1 Tax=Micromonospora qiuiae TaxID=502268 RepID=A0ABQ4J945_9ACTN|nr:DUF4037 domain-containing protein [Micromonospora qiuiae]GIJ26685.1 hypothetical protein Vqi01_18470 [Micromonospora qiuiae]